MLVLCFRFTGSVHFPFFFQRVFFRFSKNVLFFLIIGLSIFFLLSKNRIFFFFQRVFFLLSNCGLKKKKKKIKSQQLCLCLTIDLLFFSLNFFESTVAFIF